MKKLILVVTVLAVSTDVLAITKGARMRRSGMIDRKAQAEALVRKTELAQARKEVREKQLTLLQTRRLAPMSQQRLMNRVATSHAPVLRFVKDQPNLLLKIESVEQVLEIQKTGLLGSVDATKYTPEYIQSNIGSAINIQFKKDGTPDVYIIGKSTFDEKYRPTDVKEVETKNPNVFKSLKANPQLNAIYEAQSQNFIGGLKMTPVEMMRLSDLGFKVEEKANIQSPWNDVQSKPAGKEGYLVLEKEKDGSLSKVYLVNEENGLPISYIAAP